MYRAVDQYGQVIRSTRARANRFKSGSGRRLARTTNVHRFLPLQTTVRNVEAIVQLRRSS